MSYLVLFLSSLQQGHSAPINQNQQYLSWHAEPTTCGTWTILQTCVITLSLCVYSAVHLNIPEEGITKVRKITRRLKWVAMGIFAPKLVVFVAWWQWASARSLTAKMKEVVAKADKSGREPLTPWTMVHSFFAVMGGYAIEFDDPSQSGHVEYQYRCRFARIKHSHKRFTLTSEAVLRLAQLQWSYIPRLTEETTQDRSKADLITKVLVCVQAGYLIAQVIGRVVNNLTVTMLEVHALGNVSCALIMYIFWLKKPYAVNDPVVVTDSARDSILAISQVMDRSCWFANKSSFIGGTDVSPHSHPVHAKVESAMPLLVKRWSTWELPSLEKTDQSPALLANSQSVQTVIVQRNQNVLDTNINAFVPHTEGSDTAHRSGVDDSVPENPETARVTAYFDHLPSKDEQSSWTHLDRILIVWDGYGVKLEIEEIKRLLATSDFWSQFDMKVYRASSMVPESFGWDYCDRLEVALPTDERGDVDARPVLHLTTRDLAEWDLVWRVQKGRKWDHLHYDRNVRYLQVRSANWPWPETSDHRSFPGAILFATALYGGLHALCWHAHFPSLVEQWIWRVSALVIAGSGFVVSLWVALGNLLESHKKGNGSLSFFVAHYMVRSVSLLNKMTNPHHFWIGERFCDAIQYFVLVPYCAARAFIVIEAFISLRSLPEEAYQSPDWTAFLPHL